MSSTPARRSISHLGALLVCTLGAAGRDAQAGACEGGQAELRESASAAITAWASAQGALYEGARDQATACFDALREPFSPETSASWLRLSAFNALYKDKDLNQAKRLFAAAYVIDPDFILADSAVAGNKSLGTLLTGAKAIGAGEPLPLAVDPALRLWVNGAVAEARPSTVPVLFQVESPTLGMLETKLLFPEAAYRPDEVPGIENARAALAHQRRFALRSFEGGGAALLAGLAVEGGYAVFGSRIGAAAVTPEAEARLILRTNRVHGAAGALVGTGVGFLALGLALR